MNLDISGADQDVFRDAGIVGFPECCRDCASNPLREALSVWGAG
jgi:hypothetical protein